MKLPVAVAIVQEPAVYPATMSTRHKVDVMQVLHQLIERIFNAHPWNRRVIELACGSVIWFVKHGATVQTKPHGWSRQPHTLKLRKLSTLPLTNHNTFSRTILREHHSFTSIPHPLSPFALSSDNTFSSKQHSAVDQDALHPRHRRRCAVCVCLR